MSENGNDRIKDYLRSHYTVVASSVDPKGYVLAKLFEAGVLTTRQLRYLNGIVDQNTRWVELFDQLFETSHPNAFVVLKKALLKDYSWVFNEFENKEIGGGASISAYLASVGNRGIDVEASVHSSENVSIANISIEKITPFRSSENQNQPGEMPQTDLDEEGLINRFRTAVVKNKLVKHMDPDNGLLFCLQNNGIIEREDYERLDGTKPYSKLNENLIVYHIEPNIENHWSAFLESLIENEQDHIVKFINSPENVGEDRLLNSEEIEVINNNLFSLVSLIDPFRMKFLHRLVSKKCITDRHADRVETFETCDKKVYELLIILKRRRHIDFVNFKICLRETMQNKIVDILEKGGIAKVHVKLKKIKDRDVIEAKLVDLVTGYVDESNEIDKRLTEQQVAIIKDLLKDLENEGIYIIGNSAWRSIAMFFRCRDEDSVKAFAEFVDSGKLKEILEQLFNRILSFPEHSDDQPYLERSSCADRDLEGRVEIAGLSCSGENSADVPVNPECVSDRMENLLLSDSQFPESANTEIPRISGVMLEEVLQRTSYLMWRTLYETPTFGLGSGGVSHIETFWSSVKYTVTMVRRTCSTVCLEWRNIISARWFAFRQKLFQTIFLSMIHPSRGLLIERMIVRYGLLEELKKKNIITQDDVVDYELTFDDVEESAEPAELKKRVLKCLQRKRSHNTMFKFLHSLETSCQSHLVNHIVGSGEKSSGFGNNWPLDEDKRNRIIDSQDKLTKIDFLVHVPEPFSWSWFRYSRRSDYPFKSEHSYHFSAKDATEVTSIANPHDLLPSVHFVEVEEQMSSPIPYHTGKKFDFKDSRPKLFQKNLLQILFVEKCISESRKRNIEEKQRSKASELLLRILQNGSIKTYDLTADYLKRTEQRDMLDTLIGNYRPEDLNFSVHINIENTKGIAGLVCFENEIYVIAAVSNIVHVYSGIIPFEELKDKKLEIKQLKSPSDMCISDKFGSLLISDCHRANKCVWTVQLLNREIRQAVKQLLIGLPMKMSITRSDELVVVVEQDLPRRYSLISYSVPDINQLKFIKLPTEINKVIHASQISNGNFIISYERRNAGVSVKGISELSCSGGGEFIRTLSDSLSDSKNWFPEYLCVDEYDRVFIADSSKGQSEGDRVLILNSSWSEIQPLLDAKAHHMDRPARLWYSPEKHQLIVGQGRYKGSFCIFNFNHVKGINE